MFCSHALKCYKELIRQSFWILISYFLIRCAGLHGRNWYPVACLASIREVQYEATWPKLPKQDCSFKSLSRSLTRWILIQVGTIKVKCRNLTYSQSPNDALNNVVYIFKYFIAIGGTPVVLGNIYVLSTKYFLNVFWWLENKTSLFNK